MRQPRDPVPAHSLPPMAKGSRKRLSTTLTKLDPAILRPKPQAISQHAAGNGTRVTTTIKPVRGPPEKLEESGIFNADPSNFRDEHHEDGASEDEVIKEYYVSRVRSFFSCV